MGFHQLADGAITRRLEKLAGVGMGGRSAFGKLPRRDLAGHRTGVRQDRNGLRYERRRDEDVKIEQQLRIWPRYQLCRSIDHDLARVSRIYPAQR
jgi:hypothetical protein